MHQMTLLLFMVAAVSPAVGTLLTQLAAIVVPLIASFFSTELAKFNSIVNTWPTWVVNAFGVVFAALIGALVQLVPGLQLPGSLGGWTQDAISAALMFLVHVLIPMQNALKTRRVKRGLRPQ